MSELRNTLQEMGFSVNRIEAAIRNTSGDNLEEAVQWIEDHQAKFDAEETKGVDADAPINEADLTEEQLVKFRSAAAQENPAKAQEEGADAAASQRPQTEEEKAAKLEVLKEKAAVRKAEQAKKDAEERKRNEMINRKKEKDYRQIVEEQQQKEALKEAAKKKKEAQEDAAAKRRIKELIEQDKRDRQNKRQQGGSSSNSSPPQPAAAGAAQSEGAKKTAAPKPTPVQRTESKIRFRMPNNENIMLTFPLTATVTDVVTQLASENSLDASSVKLVTTFPTQTFTVSDTKTLTEAGLVNASVMVKL